MLPKKQERLVLLPDGELPVDMPVESTLGHEISSDALEEVLPKLYLTHHRKPGVLLLFENEKLKKRRASSRQPDRQLSRAQLNLLIIVFVFLVGIAGFLPLEPLTHLFRSIFVCGAVVNIASWLKANLFRKRPRRNVDEAPDRAMRVTEVGPRGPRYGGSFAWEFGEFRRWTGDWVFVALGIFVFIIGVLAPLLDRLPQLFYGTFFGSALMYSASWLKANLFRKRPGQNVDEAPDSDIDERPFHPSVKYFLGRVTGTCPHGPQGGGSFDWVFTMPDGSRGGRREEVPQSELVPQVGTPVLVAYQKPGNYRLL